MECKKLLLSKRELTYIYLCGKNNGTVADFEEMVRQLQDRQGFNKKMNKVVEECASNKV